MPVTLLFLFFQVFDLTFTLINDPGIVRSQQLVNAKTNGLIIDKIKEININVNQN